MKSLDNLSTNIINKFFLILIISFFLLIFFLEFIYLLPSPTGDDLWFLKLTFNICREDLFVSTNISIFKQNAESIKWTSHGWFSQYILAKLNINCSLRGLFFVSFFIKLFSSILIYLILKDKKLDLFYIYLLIFLTLVIQLKIQYRPETFVIFLYLFLIYNFFKDNYLTVGICLSLIFFTQPTFILFIGLFGLIIYYEKFLKNFINIFLGVLICSLILMYIYPYSLTEYIDGLWNHRGVMRGSQTILDGGLNLTYLNNLITYYVYTSFLPLFLFLFSFLYLALIYKKKLLILTFPLIFFFGPNSPSSNYVLIGMTPFLIILFIEFIENTKTKLNYFSFLFSLVLIVSTFGISQYFLRNIFTAITYSQELNKTKNFLLDNIDNIDTFPGFSFMLDDKLKFVSIGKIDRENLKIAHGIDELPNDYKLNIYSVNGSRNPCPDNRHYENKPQQIKIFSKKIFNSNSGYGIWICN